MGAYISFMGFGGAIPPSIIIRFLKLQKKNKFPRSYQKKIILLLIIIDLFIHKKMLKHPTGNAFSTAGSKKDEITNKYGLICACLNFSIIVNIALL